MHRRNDPDSLLDALTPDQLREADPLKALSTQAVHGERARLDLGKRLLLVRPTWPRSGRKAGGWKLFLEAAGIEKRTAQRYMRSAISEEKNRDSVSQKPRPTLLERVMRLIRKLTDAERGEVAKELSPKLS